MSTTVVKKCKNGTHRIGLRDGQTVAMASDPQSQKSFQALAVHQVPKLENKDFVGKGWRLNFTVRTMETEKKIQNPLTLDGDFTPTSRVDIGEGCQVLLWDKLLSKEDKPALRAELLQIINKKGTADVTKMYGKTYTNKGRKVLEMAAEEGFKYRYAGKTVTGIAFTPLVRDVLMPKMAQLFGVPIDKLWAHLVFYPTRECKLDWHDDGEDGINPHLIVSITFLEHPHFPRAFDVRLKSTFPKKFKGSVSSTSASKRKRGESFPL